MYIACVLSLNGWNYNHSIGQINRQRCRLGSECSAEIQKGRYVVFRRWNHHFGPGFYYVLTKCVLLFCNLRLRSENIPYEGPISAWPLEQSVLIVRNTLSDTPLVVMVLTVCLRNVYRQGKQCHKYCRHKQGVFKKIVSDF